MNSFCDCPPPGIIKILFHFAYISTSENDKDFIFFSKDASWKALQNLYKKDRNQLVTTVFSYSKWTAYVIVTLPSIIKILFHFAYISTLETDKDLIFFQKDAPWKALHKLYEQIHIQRRKVFETFLICWDTALPCSSSMLSKEKPPE
jgi:hypothetical protein